jgi:hypothetical protein
LLPFLPSETQAGIQRGSRRVQERLLHLVRYRIVGLFDGNCPVLA